MISGDTTPGNIFHPGIDFAQLTQPLRRLKRGAISSDEFLDEVLFSSMLDFAALPPAQSENVARTATDLHHRVFTSSAAQDCHPDPSDRDHFATEAMVRIVARARSGVAEGLRRSRYGDDGPTQVQAFRAYWAEEIARFVEASPGELRTDRVRITADIGVDGLLPTDVLLESIANCRDSHPIPAERMAQTLVVRFIHDGEAQRSLSFAANFGDGAERLLLTVARLLPEDAPQWAELVGAVRDRREAIRRDASPDAALYAAANAAHRSQPELARTLIDIADIDSVEHRIELHALAALIHQYLGETGQALACAQTCRRQAVAGAESSDNPWPTTWSVPKAAGWLLVAAEPDPAARIELLKRTYSKYDSRGAVEGRLMLQAAETYLDLDQPVLAAYFLQRARELANDRGVGDHLHWCVQWDYVASLLDVARVTEDELHTVTERLAGFGYLPHPPDGQRFWLINESWSNHLDSEHPELVRPEPARIPVG